jgi:hypothetical protein
MSDSPVDRIPEDDDNTEAPLTMAASVVLTNLPRDASKALEMAGTLGIEKGKFKVSFSPAFLLALALRWLQKLPRYHFPPSFLLFSSLSVRHVDGDGKRAWDE